MNHLPMLSPGATRIAGVVPSRLDRRFARRAIYPAQYVDPECFKECRSNCISNRPPGVPAPPWAELCDFACALVCATECTPCFTSPVYGKVCWDPERDYPWRYVYCDSNISPNICTPCFLWDSQLRWCSTSTDSWYQLCNSTCASCVDV